MGSINRINIYEKWHPYCIPPSGTTDYMTDYLYTNRYEPLPVTASSDQNVYHDYGYVPSSGAGKEYYNFYKTLKLYKWEAYIYEKIVSSYEWDINKHKLCSRNIPMHLLTVENGVEYVKIPEEMYFPTKQSVEIDWYQDEDGTQDDYPPEAGKAYLRQPEYEAFINSPSSVWTINHGLSGYMIFECLVGDDYERYYPEKMKYIDYNTVEITWDNPVEGSVGLVEPDEKHNFSSSSTWTVNHTLGSYEAIVQCFDSNDEFMMPETIEFTDDTTITISWDDVRTGYVLLKGIPEDDIQGYEDLGVSSKDKYQKKSEFDWDGYGVLTPHYKVEVDLTDIPMNPDANDPAILNEITWNDLINAWEETRPAHKVAHYWSLFAPLCDFSGVEKSTYQDVRYLEYAKSIFYQSLQTATPSAYIHDQTSSLKEWEITHNLGTNEVLACSYNSDNILLNPTITNIDSNTIKLTHSSAYKGKAYIVASDSTYVNPTSSTTWTADHTSGSRFYVPRVVDNSYIDLSYSNLKNTTSTYSTINFSSTEDGYVFFTLGYKYDFSNLQTWELTHNLNHDGYILDIFDPDWNLIPKSEYVLTITSPKKSLKVEWLSPKSGRIIIKPVRNEYSSSDLIDEIDNNGYFMINNSSTQTWQNLSDGSYSNSSNYLYKGNVIVNETADYYTIQCDVPSTIKGFEGKITELGIFTGTDIFVFYSHFKSIFRKYYTGIRLFMKVSKTII